MNIPTWMQVAGVIIAVIIGAAFIGAAVEQHYYGDGYGCNDGGDDDD